MRYLIGIDDTDNLESRGTGFRSRCLGMLLQTESLANLEGITRHQLLVDPRIAYTSHNSAICIAVDAKAAPGEELWRFCRDYLLRECAPGSDAGLCVAAWDSISAEVMTFGRSAKEEVVSMQAALRLAERAGLLLEGLTGDYSGVIGALAAVGLHAGDNDGRFIWLEGVRELQGVYTTEQLYAMTAIEEIRSMEGITVPGSARINVDPWPRPVLQNGRAVLLVKKIEPQNDLPDRHSGTGSELHENGHAEWQLLAREIIREY